MDDKLFKELDANMKEAVKVAKGISAIVMQVSSYKVTTSKAFTMEAGHAAEP